MKKHELKSLVRHILKEMSEDHGLGYSHNNSQAKPGLERDPLNDPTFNGEEELGEEIKDKDMEMAKEIANEIWSGIYLVNFVQEVRGVKVYEVVLHGSDGPKHALKKDKDGKWYRYKSDEITHKWVPAGSNVNTALPSQNQTKTPTWNPSGQPSLKMK